MLKNIKEEIVEVRRLRALNLEQIEKIPIFVLDAATLVCKAIANGIPTVDVSFVTTPVGIRVMQNPREWKSGEIQAVLNDLREDFPEMTPEEKASLDDIENLALAGQFEAVEEKLQQTDDVIMAISQERQKLMGVIRRRKSNAPIGDNVVTVAGNNTNN